MKLRHYPAILEINTRVWLEKLKTELNQPLTLGSVPVSVWEGIKNQGFDAVWLMGIWQPSPKAVELAQNLESLQHEYRQCLADLTPSDIIGSPYAIYNYTPNPALGSWSDVDTLRQRLHNLDMGLLLDFVPNHMAIDHPWTIEQPDLFIQSDDEELTFLTPPGTRLCYGRDPKFPPWKDTVQLNYFNPKTRAAMINELIAISSHCDGVRCDMAMLLLNDIFVKTWFSGSDSNLYQKPSTEFWSEAIESTKNTAPDFTFIAESYWDTESKLQSLGFDFTYDKNLYDTLLSGDASSVSAYLTNQYKPEKWLRFIENHDEKRAVQAFGREKSLAAASVTYYLPGARLFYDGQLTGKTVKTPVQLGRDCEEPQDPKVFECYKKMVPSLSEPLYRDGEWGTAEVKGWEGNLFFRHLVAYIWIYKKRMSAVVVNLSEFDAQGNVRLETIETKKDVLQYVNRINGTAWSVNKADVEAAGLYVKLLPFETQILEFEF